MYTLKLIRPIQEYADQVMAYRQEMLDNGDSLDGCAALEDTNSYAEWADFEGRLRERYGEGYVPSDVYLAVRKSDDRLIGMIDFRRPLTEFLLRFGGISATACVLPSGERVTQARCFRCCCPSAERRGSTGCCSHATRTTRRPAGL